MPFFRGNAWQIGFGHQTAELALINPTQSYRWQDGSAVDNDAKITDEYEGDGTIDVSFYNKDSSLWKGKLVYFPRGQDIGQLLCMAMGGVASETLKSAITGITITASGTGGTIPAATYHYNAAFLYGQVEGPSFTDQTVVVASTNNVTVASIPTDADATKIRVYRSAAAGTAYTGYTDFNYIPGTTTSVVDTGVQVYTLFPAAFATPTAVTGKVHYFKPQTALDFWTCEFGTLITGGSAPSNQVRLQIADCLPTKLTVEWDPGKPIKVTLEFVGKYSQVVAALQAAAFDSTSKPLIMANSTFIADGVATAFVGKGKLEYGLTINDQTILTHIYPESLFLQRRKIMVDYELMFQDASQYYKFFSGGVVTTPTAGVSYDTPQIATGALDLRFVAGGTDPLNALGLTVPNLSYAIKSVQPHLDGKPFAVPVSGTATVSAGQLMTGQVRNTKATVY